MTAPAATRRHFRSLRWQYLVARNGTFAALVVLLVVFSTMNSRFISTANAVAILQQSAPLAVTAALLALHLGAGSLDQTTSTMSEAL